MVVVPGSGGMTSSGGAPSGGMGGVPGPKPIANCDTHSQCDDSDPCTDDTCFEGFCLWNDNGTCECKRDEDCNDENACTANTCQEHECVSQNVEGTCEDDGNPCTDDVCEMGACSNLDSGVCGENTIVIRSMRWNNPGQWVALDEASALDWDIATALTEAELFEREDIAATDTFRLRALSSDLYVTLGEADALVADGSEEDAAIFSSYVCGAELGIRTESDDEDWHHWKAWEAGVMRSDGSTCNHDNIDAWERFEFIGVSPPGMGGAGGMSSF